MAGNRLLAIALVLALALRGISAFLSSGYSHPHEMSRLFEPMAFLNGYASLIPWEFEKGLFYWLPIFFQKNFIESLGVSPPIQVTFLRLLYATLSLSTVWATWSLLKALKASRKTLLISTLLVAIWPEWVFQSVHLMDFVWEWSAFGIALAIFFHGSKSGIEIKKWRPIAAGIVLGLAFFFRYQTGLFFLALIAAWFAFNDRSAFKKTFHTTFIFGLSYGTTIALVALILDGPSQWLDPFWRYLEYNVLDDGAAKDFGADPWHRYFSEGAKIFGFLPFFILFICSLVRGNRVLQILFFFPFLTYSLISHKEVRFLYGYAWLLLPLGINACDRLIQSLKTEAVRKRAWLALYLSLAIGLSLQMTRIKKSYFLHAGDISHFWRIGNLIQAEKKSPAVHLSILSNPDHLPSNYFLRLKHGQICYIYPNATKGMCPPQVAQKDDLDKKDVEQWILSDRPVPGQIQPVRIGRWVVGKVKKSAR